MHNRSYFMPFILMVVSSVNKNGELGLGSLQALEFHQFSTYGNSLA
jgi:hypothetical protein